ncbi:MAG TPA: chemotaxis protein CheX [Candidatus Limnocylindrales bacterium]|nr:chemotaxis protein CheX [Candidatus Limnocylindrales bacterium]
MNLKQFIVDAINDSTVQVFSTMLGVDIAAGESSVETSAPGSNDGVVSFLGMAGTWVGNGSLTCSPLLACRVCSHMLMTETSSVNEEVLDAVAELTNMVVGGVKTALEGQLGPLGLSIPTVVYGRNFKTRSSGTAEWIVVRFLWDGEELVVKLCLTPQDRASHPAMHAAAQNCALEV